MYLKVSLSSIFLAVHLRKIIFLTIKLYIYIRYILSDTLGKKKQLPIHLRKILFLAKTLYIYILYIQVHLARKNKHPDENYNR